MGRCLPIVLHLKKIIKNLIFRFFLFFEIKLTFKLLSYIYYKIYQKLYILINIIQMNGFQMHFYTSLSVRFVGGVEKWQDGKLVGVWKSRRIEKI